MINEMREFVLELVQSEYETGNQLVETKDEFEQLCADEGIRCTNAMWDLYQKYHMEGLEELATEEFDEILEEALSNKEKLKRAYPELNFDNPVTETLTEAVDAEDKMQTAVGILYDMDSFVLSVYDNDYWLSMGVPDGEFSENDRDLAEANYKEHEWLIEDDGFDTEAFKDLLDAFQTATRGRDYDQNERARIIHEAEVILNMSESVEDMDKRCEECNALLNDMGKCPKCDDGEEDLEEKVLVEKDFRTPDEKAMAKASNRDAKAVQKLKNNAEKIVAQTDIADKRAKTATFYIVDPTNGKVVKELNQSQFLKIAKDKPKIRYNAFVVDADGNVMRRALQAFKPGQLHYVKYAVDISKPKYEFTYEYLNGEELKPVKSPVKRTPKKTTSEVSNPPEASEQPEVSVPAEKDTLVDFVKAVKLLKPEIVDDAENVVDLSDIKADNLHKYWIKVSNKLHQLDKFINTAKKNGLLENMDLDKISEAMNEELDEGLSTAEFEELKSLAAEIGMKTGADLNKFAEEEKLPGESMLDALRRYRDDLGDDFELIDEEFSTNSLIEEFTNYAAIKDSFAQTRMNYGQQEAFDSMMSKACNALDVDPFMATIFEDSDREFDPIYFADESKELQYNVLKVKVFDLDVVRIEFKGNIYIVFKSKADADVYMGFAH